MHSEPESQDRADERDTGHRHRAIPALRRGDSSEWTDGGAASAHPSNQPAKLWADQGIATTFPFCCHVLGLTGDMAVRFTRRQFPLKLAWVMTIKNRKARLCDELAFVSQLEVFFKKKKLQYPDPVFAHGQLYLALSRVSNRGSLRVASRVTAAEDPNENGVINVVWTEVFC